MNEKRLLHLESWFPSTFFFIPGDENKFDGRDQATIPYWTCGSFAISRWTHLTFSPEMLPQNMMELYQDIFWTSHGRLQLEKLSSKRDI
ncbi:hypothetical protein PoB_005735800 [Plakobranchus ocellatus]|uniref:Uncharacterized protein n=1 Tax=Plakobranchus ocellatus TaxID=259542 RepID=A0AAV4CIE8_9GAST|nr:hypothetical protein PoB_005735800 [Plakobranchus ocellatus]